MISLIVYELKKNSILKIALLSLLFLAILISALAYTDNNAADFILKYFFYNRNTKVSLMAFILARATFIFSILVATSSIYSDNKNKTNNFFNTKPLKRKLILKSKLIATVIEGLCVFIIAFILLTVFNKFSEIAFILKSSIFLLVIYIFGFLITNALLLTDKKLKSIFILAIPVVVFYLLFDYLIVKFDIPILSFLNPISTFHLAFVKKTNTLEILVINLIIFIALYGIGLGKNENAS